MTLCAIWYHLYNLKNVKNTNGGVLLLVTLLHGCFSRILYCINGTKSHKAPHIIQYKTCRNTPLFQHCKNKISQAAVQRQRHQKSNKRYVEALPALKTFVLKLHSIRADYLLLVDSFPSGGQDHSYKKVSSFKGIVKRGEPCKCDIRLVSRIL